MTPDMAVVTPLNNPGGPEGDTVTVDEQLLNTEYWQHPLPDKQSNIRRAEISRPPCLVRRMRNGGPCNSGPHRSGLAMASGPWLDEARPLIGHTSLSAAAAAVRTPLPLP